MFLLEDTLSPGYGGVGGWRVRRLPTLLCQAPVMGLGRADLASLFTTVPSCTGTHIHIIGAPKAGVNGDIAVFLVFVIKQETPAI